MQEDTPQKTEEDASKAKKQISRKKTITDAQGRKVTVNRDAEEIDKLDQANEIDEAYEK